MKLKRKPTKKPILLTETDKAPLVYSTKFNNYINNMLSICRIDRDELPIVDFLYDLVDKPCEVSYIDITDKEDTVTLIPSPKIYKIYKKEHTEVYKEEFNDYISAEMDMYDIHPYIKGYSGVWKSNRVEVKIGKLIKKLNNKLSDKQIEDFVNKYKAIYRNRNNNKLSIVSGKDIKHWYNQDNYQHTPDDRSRVGLGTLGKSCMRHGTDLFDLYAENPEVCSLLILQTEDDKTIIGRALVWQTTDGVYMDRIYTHFDSDIHVFRAYADQHGWSTHYDEVKKRGKNKVPKIIQLTNSSFKKYPYLDSFPYLNKLDKTLSTHVVKEVDVRKYIYSLRTADGRAERLR